MTAPPSPTKLLEAALAYARRGWPVFPLHTPAPDGCCSCANPKCEKPGKHPRTPHGFKDATTNESIIKAWWKQWPDANIGIATGAVSRLAVLDIDNKHDGMAKLHDLEAQHRDLPITLTVRTGNGYHLYFLLDGFSLKSRAAIAGIVGLDVRAEGGYVVAPPSRHCNGNVYLVEHDPRAELLPTMPTWLINLITAPAIPDTRASSKTSGERLQEGKRNDALFRLGCSLRTKNLTEAAITAALLALNTERCDPPLPEPEVHAIGRSAARYPNSANIANSANQGNAVDSWDPPTPFHEFDLPLFPMEALPEPLRAFVEAEAVATQTPPDLAGMLTLSVCAASCAKKVVVQVDEGWTEPLNIFTANLQESGTRKSAGFRDSVAPLEKYEADECRRMGPEVNAAETRYNIAKNTLENAERAAAKAPADEQEALSKEAEELARHLAEMHVPVLPRYLADDSTPESLSKLLHEQNGRLALMSPEGGIFGIMAGRYSQNGTRNIDVYLKAHAGDTLRVDRVGRGAEHVESPALTLGLAIQPQVLQGLTDKPTFRGRGLLARFLYSLPANLVGRRKPRQPAVPFDVRSRYHDIVVKMLELPWNVDADEERLPHLLLLDPDARDRLQAFEEWLEPQLGDGGDLASIADWGSKLAGAVMRLAGILHTVSNIDHPEPWGIPISPTTVESAIKLGKYLIPHAKAAHALMGADAVVEDAKRLIRWIARSGRTEFTKRDVFEGTKGHFKKVAEMEPALALLSDHEYIRERPVADRVGPGRKPAPIYDVNPHSQNSHNSHNSADATYSANTANSATTSQGSTPTPETPIPTETADPEADPTGEAR